jgi:hypothetical protein
MKFVKYGLIALIVAVSVAACTTTTSGTAQDHHQSRHHHAKHHGHRRHHHHHNLTVSQQNAISTAKQYLSTQGFSRRGLIQQLSSKAGPRKDAVFAVDHIKVNWRHQAVRVAKQYLSIQGFSRRGLIQQLQSKAGSGFTHAQAVYAANHVGL